MEGASIAGGLVGINFSSLLSMPQRSRMAPEHAVQLEAPSMGPVGSAGPAAAWGKGYQLTEVKH